jgi:hypothetical protein
MVQSQNIRTILFSWVLLLIVALFYTIKPDFEYSWWWVILHGPLIPANWILSFFDASKLCKAPIHTTVYNILWWISCVCTIFTTVMQAITLILSFFRKK